MSKLYYCLDCKRVFEEEMVCQYCSGNNVKELVKDSPVNVLGSKLKGKILKVEQLKAKVLIVDENKSKYIKEYEADKLKKIL